jgi:hypothetical protein
MYYSKANCTTGIALHRQKLFLFVEYFLNLEMFKVKFVYLYEVCGLCLSVRWVLWEKVDFDLSFIQIIYYIGVFTLKLRIISICSYRSTMILMSVRS